jgi:hypothetical protein
VVQGKKENIAMQSNFIPIPVFNMLLHSDSKIGGMTEGLASNRSAKLGSKTHLQDGLSRFDFGDVLHSKFLPSLVYWELGCFHV